MLGVKLSGPILSEPSRKLLFQLSIYCTKELFDRNIELSIQNKRNRGEILSKDIYLIPQVNTKR